MLTPSVLTEIVEGDALTMGRAAKLLPASRGEGTLAASTLWRWVTHGSRASDGRSVKLEAARVGGRWLTSKAALQRFMSALTPSAEPTSAPPSPTDAEQREAGERAAARLAALGA